jgi:hypothetical protein
MKRKTSKIKPQADANLVGRNKWLFPNDPELQDLHVTLPNSCISEIDAAIDELHPALKDREDFLYMAVQFALKYYVKKAASRISLGPRSNRPTRQQGESLVNSAQIRRPQVLIEEHGFEAGVPQLSAQQRDAAARAKVVRGPLMAQ